MDPQTAPPTAGKPMLRNRQSIVTPRARDPTALECIPGRDSGLELGKDTTAQWPFEIIRPSRLSIL